MGIECARLGEDLLDRSQFGFYPGLAVSRKCLASQATRPVFPAASGSASSYCLILPLAETKSSLFTEDLRLTEQDKTRCSG